MDKNQRGEELDSKQIFEKRLNLYKEEHQRLTTLLNVTRNISKEIELTKLLITIMDEVKRALKADRCTVFLIDRDKKELWSKVAHGEKDIRFPLHLGIAGHVAITGEVLNIPNAYADIRFNAEIDKQTGYRTHNMLTFPMRNKLHEIIGVFQVLNKYDGSFSNEDENLLDVISTIAATQLENAQLYEEQKKTLESFVETLASTIDARDSLTAGHSKRIAEYSLEIADIINFPMKRRELLRYAALLHDYGKIAIREGVLYKEGSLTIEEYCKIQEHPAITKSILENINFSRDFKELPQIAGAHHEKLNGTGYPEGLTGKQIPLEARILSIVDVFDAMTSRRPYRDRMEFEIVMDSMESTVGAQLDQDLFSAFKKIKLDRLIQILAKEEEDNSHLLIKQDLMFMRAYDIQQLVDIIKRGAANADERKIMELFYKYYYRQYINGIDTDVEKKYKLASI
ncbi:MAG: HD domain-containing phosphohydrolase [bacterium]|nr:HD domain-containing phosphohydrolase [bacterium]